MPSLLAPLSGHRGTIARGHVRSASTSTLGERGEFWRDAVKRVPTTGWMMLMTGDWVDGLGQTKYGPRGAVLVMT
eukprot:3907620-Prymnesium_polylepis.2